MMMAPVHRISANIAHQGNTWNPQHIQTVLTRQRATLPYTGSLNVASLLHCVCDAQHTQGRRRVQCCKCSTAAWANRRPWFAAVKGFSCGKEQRPRQAGRWQQLPLCASLLQRSSQSPYINIMTLTEGLDRCIPGWYLLPMLCLCIPATRGQRCTASTVC